MNLENILSFLKKLARNNNREWFEKNKTAYLAAKADFETFIEALYPALVEVDESLAGLEPKKCIFRIYRDVRFSKDKVPYKKNMSAAFSSQGKTMTTPGYYIHLQPGNESFIGLGLYGPQPDVLAKVRQEIDYNGEHLEQIVNNKVFKKYFGSFWTDDALKTMPKGFAKDHPHAEWLKLKSYIVTHTFSDEEVLNKNFRKEIIAITKAGKPLIDFLTASLD